MDVLFIYSGKGGVGKSTLAVNLTYSLPHIKVGLLDADFEGPSIPTMVSQIENSPMVAKGLGIQPGDYAGVSISSLGLLKNNNLNISLPSKYLEGALYQLLSKAEWEVDLLIIDMPPGTSDVHYQLFNLLKGHCLLVTTPQTVSFVDTQKGINLLRRMEVPILGIVENMAHFECECCGHSNSIFSGDTKSNLADPNKLDILDKLPIIPGISTKNNAGIPFVLAYPDHPLSKRMAEFGNELLSLLMKKISTWRVN
ncbi:hypothetical protein PaeCFBP13512_02925 [Paenibacillus sp. CFBP13512]|uniref:P-loop NTPase n=1 Tax=Paenibacillus sp. CFBP13512 TaxID=2184007 RepID=UPI0010BFF153|nr:P-loop NTPase [Paenibacillus sp. CFBP13512]TKJ93368.1 hypothetical protein PaeCFBP13512_02925 [Paenibacillus sp. CFBP13512]